MNDDLTSLLNLFDAYLGSAQYFPFLLLGTGVFFTLYLKFPQLRFFNHAFRIVRGKYDRDDSKGDATHFQALATAISGTVGTGNIAGVATAVFLGGPGALFWMWVIAVVGMATKFCEAVLAVRFREKDALGNHVGPEDKPDKRYDVWWNEHYETNHCGQSLSLAETAA